MSSDSPARASSSNRVRFPFLWISLGVNLVLAAVLALYLFWPSDTESGERSLVERHYSGDHGAVDKIAVVRISGLLIETGTEFAHRQIERAAKDKSVKAVVVRIESPGGTISASERLYTDLIHLRDNTNPRYAGTAPKPLVASMGSIAASGGFYVAMPAGKVVAEPTTITGSIGVFAALPNVSELAHKNGVHVELIKAGSIKGGGSPFQALTPEERQPWQEMVDHAYDRFLEVVASGRPGLTKQRLVSETTERQVYTYDEKGVPIKGADGKPITVKAVRYRADGGTYTPPQAKELGLIDDLAGLSAAIASAAELAKLSKYRAIVYERPKGLAEQLLGVELRQSHQPLEIEALGQVLTPKLWYLSPQFELVGRLSEITTP